MNIIRNEYLDKLISKKHNGRVKIITGIRRCGKSYLLFNLFKNHLIENGVDQTQILTMNLDDIANVKYHNPIELYKYFLDKISNKDIQYYVFIDEIQNCKSIKNPYVEQDDQLINFTGVLIGLMLHENVDIYVTGSNSKMLSSEIVTEFRDRGDEIKVNPLTFKEIYNSKQVDNFDLKTYFIYGGMPFVYKIESNTEKAKYLQNLFTTTYIRDILDRYKINNEHLILETLLNFISSNIGSLTNPNKLSNRFLSESKIKINANTVSKYIEYFKEAYIISKAKRYDVKGAKYFSTPLKYYFTDIGLRNAWLNFSDLDRSHIMENIVYNELKARGFNVDVGYVTYDQKTDKSRNVYNLEIDFIANLIDTKYYIQVALNLDEPDKKEQEIRPLLQVKDNYKKIVIVYDDIFKHYDSNGILYVGLKEFLLDVDVFNV
ncbi:ATP-binding protein [Mycoplasma yeatsii]|uniref:AAA+ superfamily ATPase n=1 Tax=Mycoplasma yeatsii TaxID=51365 RepID=A0ABU0NF92_9MOLU|nr:ATP-binding protein [Mycoplasma yeatsii]MDQ0568116.1 putative AAA+ superfamily ATPase [Mycoplasma yeatsii]